MKKELIRVSKSFSFDMAHALYNYDGACRNIHGHTYHLQVTLLGTAIQNEKNSKNGMVIDFSVIKEIVYTEIIKKYDHALVLYKKDAKKLASGEHSLYKKMIATEFQPSCENLLLHFKEMLQKKFGKKIKLVQLRLDETPTSFAEWRIEDN